MKMLKNSTIFFERERVTKKVECEDESDLTISLLVNAIFYFIESVFIVAHNDKYRLVAIHQGRLLVDKEYETSKGAKIAFLKFYGYKAWREDVKPIWSKFYSPDPKWVWDKIDKGGQSEEQKLYTA